MCDNRETTLEECRDELTKVENTLEVLLANGSRFYFFMIVIIGIQLGRFMMVETKHQQEDPDDPDFIRLEAMGVFDLAKSFAQGFESQGVTGVEH